MKQPTVLLLAALLVLSTSTHLNAAPSDKPVALTTVAIRVHHMAKMVTFYEEAFDAQFREVDTSGLRSQFGEVGGITLKLVPLRRSADFEGYPSHQLGFEVDDVEAVIAIAIRHGGRQEGSISRDGNRIHGSVRDPDGNTLEIYSRTDSSTTTE